MRSISVVALIVSLSSLGFAVWTWRQSGARAEEALRRREQALVDQYSPKIRLYCQQMGLKEPPADAKTLDELITPLTGLMQGLSR
jgi:hypothetical protein